MIAPCGLLGTSFVPKQGISVEYLDEVAIFDVELGIHDRVHIHVLRTSCFSLFSDVNNDVVKPPATPMQLVIACSAHV